MQDSLPAAGPALPGGIGYPQGSCERFHGCNDSPFPSFLARCQFIFSGKNDELTPDFPTPDFPDTGFPHGIFLEFVMNVECNGPELAPGSPRSTLKSHALGAALVTVSSRDSSRGSSVRAVPVSPAEETFHDRRDRRPYQFQHVVSRRPDPRVTSITST